MSSSSSENISFKEEVKNLIKEQGQNKLLNQKDELACIFSYEFST